jgi:hypothetical protein
MSTGTLIADRIEIADLFTRFARLLDEGRYEDADTRFTDDVEVYSPRIQVRGIKKVVDYMRQAQVEGEHTQHMTTDLLVNINGDQARPRRTRSCTSTATANHPTKQAACDWPALRYGRRRAGDSARHGTANTTSRTTPTSSDDPGNRCPHPGVVVRPGITSSALGTRAMGT